MFLRVACLLTLAVPSAIVPSLAAQSPLGRAIPGRYIVTYRNSTIPMEATTGSRILARHVRLGMAVVEAGDTATVTALRRDPAVEMVVADRLVTAHAIKVRAAAVPVASADSIYHSAQGWAVRQVGGFGLEAKASGPWTITRGRGVRIAILDSGVDATHPDLTGNLALSLSEVNQAALPSVCDDGSPFDQQGHGTWTASLAAGALGDATGMMAGVAPEASILNIKVLERMPAAPTAGDPSGCNAGQASGLLSWVLQGIEDAVANRADVISMSLGTLVDITTGDGAGLKATFDHATHAAFNAGVILIAAAGNDAFDLANARYVELPAQSRDVLAIVASTNPACAEDLAPGAVCAPAPASHPVTRPYYSNFGGPLHALAAPGGSYPAGPDADPSRATGWIRGACSVGKPASLLGPPSDANHSLACFGLGKVAYVQAMGTSAAAPLAAGVAALIRAAHPTWDAATVVATMRSTARVLPGLGVAQIDASAAVVPSNPQGNPITVGVFRAF